MKRAIGTILKERIAYYHCGKLKSSSVAKLLNDVEHSIKAEHNEVMKNLISPRKLFT